MIEPPKQNGVGVNYRVRAEIRASSAITPRNMNPRAGNQELVFARGDGPSMRCEGKKTVDTPFEIGVVPARNVKRRDTDTVKRLTGIKRGPVFPEFRVIKPIKNIRGQTFPLERGVTAEWQHT